MNLLNSLNFKREPLILFDDMNSNQIGYFMGTAKNVSEESVNFMATNGKGLVYLCIPEQIAKKMKLPFIGEKDPAHKKSFTVSVDYKTTTTGISAGERADTIRALIDPNTNPDDFKRPGHVFPIVSKERKLVDRVGISEAAVLVSELIFDSPIAYVCEILNEQGGVANRKEIEALTDKYGLSLITFSEILHYQYETTNWLQLIKQSEIDYVNKVMAYTIEDTLFNRMFKIFIKYEETSSDSVMFYNECQMGDLLKLNQCECKNHFNDYYQQLVQNKIGALVFLQEGFSEWDSYSGNQVVLKQIEKLIDELFRETGDVSYAYFLK